MGLTQFTKTVAATTTPERLIAASADGVQPFRAAVIHLEPLPSNTGVIYVGSASNVNPTGFVSVLAVLDPTQADVGLKYHDIVAPSGNNGLIPEDIWIRPSVNGEGVLGYYLTE